MSEQVVDQTGQTKISRVLVVDDDAASRKLMCKTLLREGTILVGCWWKSFLQDVGWWKCDCSTIDDEHASSIDYWLANLTEAITDAVREFKNRFQR